MPRRTSDKLPSPRDADIFRRVVLRGERMTVVARDFGLSKQRVHAIYERSRRLAFEELAEDFSEHRRQTLLRLEHVYGEAMDAWERSKAGRLSETETATGLGVPVRSMSRQVASGDVRYLSEARQTLADIRELCGLDPTKAEVLEVHTTKTHRVEIDYDAMTIEELEPLAQLAKLRRQGVIRIVDEGDSLQSQGGRGSIMLTYPPPKTLLLARKVAVTFPKLLRGDPLILLGLRRCGFKRTKVSIMEAKLLSVPLSCRPEPKRRLLSGLA